MQQASVDAKSITPSGNSVLRTSVVENITQGLLMRHHLKNISRIFHPYGERLLVASASF